MKIVDVSHLFIVLDVEDVDIVERAAYNLTLAAIVLEEKILAFYCFSFFELKLSRMLLHALEHLTFKLGRVPLKNLLCLHYVFHIFLV